eukprot:gene28160-31260_t
MRGMALRQTGSAIPSSYSTQGHSRLLPIVAKPCRGAGVRGALPSSKPRQLTLNVKAMMNYSTNPALNNGNVRESVFQSNRGRGRGAGNELMTVEGVAQKTTLLLAVAVFGAMYTWTQEPYARGHRAMDTGETRDRRCIRRHMGCTSGRMRCAIEHRTSAVAEFGAMCTWTKIFSGNAAAAMAALSMSKIAGMAGLGTALATMFKPHWSPISAPIYAICKGLAIGALSAVFELRYPGIVLNAAMLTFGVAGTLLAGFQTGLLNVTDTFRSGVMMVTGGYMFAILGMWIMSMFGVQMPGLMSSGPIGMGLCLLSSGLAASNLLLDFDMIRNTANQNMPKWFEWYSSFSLMVTLVWCYMALLRLLSMFAGRSDD